MLSKGHKWREIMKRKSRVGILLGVLGCLIALPLLAVEIITKDDIVNNVVKKEQLVKVADNAILFLDTSSSTNDDYAGTGKSIIQVMKAELKNRIAGFPDLGHNVGIYTYTGWKENLPVQLFNREKVSAALDTIPDKGGGPTPLKSGLQKLDPVLQSLKGRTAVFVFWDGEYTGADPIATAKALAKKYDACFYVISSAKPQRETEMMHNVPALNNCSRVIPLADFFNHPEYTTGALFEVKATEHVVTTTTTKITGLKVDHMNFTFNGTELADKDKGELDQVAGFMKDHPKSYAVIAGYTDDAGTKDYNEGLSKKRAEMVSGYLKGKGIESSRIVVFWYGLTNPIVPNDSPENRAKNRRVEINVGLGE
jgi:OOP family OmpA-OmpF porin